ncbi:MAG: AEC family transporter [Pseudanabaenaceae cyanobacterium]
MDTRLWTVYAPVVGWMTAGWVLLRWLPDWVPRWMGRSLYWVGVPLQIASFTLATPLDWSLLWVPVMTVLTLALGVLLGWVGGRSLPPGQKPGFILAGAIGNTGFVGLAVAPYLVDPSALGWVVMFSLVHNLVASYGFGAAIARHYGAYNKAETLWQQLRAVVLTPSLWAFGLALTCESWGWITPAIPTGLAWGAQAVSAIALLLVGIRFAQLQWEVWPQALGAAAIKTVVLPLVVGGLCTLAHLEGPQRLALVLEAGMPTALAGLILSEEYGFAPDIVLLAIAFSSFLLFPTLALWLWLFPQNPIH